jgi:tRNA modification GTPase
MIETADVLIWLGEAGETPAHPSRILVQSKADLADRPAPSPGSLAVSSHSGFGITELLGAMGAAARTLLPAENVVALNRRQADHLAVAAEAVDRASRSNQLVLLAEELRTARSAFDRLTGRAGVEDVLDALFGRFCLGK